MTMQTMQIRLTKKQIRLLDLRVKSGEFPNRVAAIREAASRMLYGECVTIEKGQNLKFLVK